jgi:hypothetical protein
MSGRSSRSTMTGMKAVLRRFATEGLEKESWVVRRQSARR